MNKPYLAEIEREFNKIIAELVRGPRTRYWEDRDTGYQYHYTIEPVNGGYWAMIYKPTGKGARSKNTRRQWRLVAKKGPYDQTTARNLARSMFNERLHR